MEPALTPYCSTLGSLTSVLQNPKDLSISVRRRLREAQTQLPPTHKRRDCCGPKAHCGENAPPRGPMFSVKDTLPKLTGCRPPTSTGFAAGTATRCRVCSTPKGQFTPAAVVSLKRAAASARAASAEPEPTQPGRRRCSLEPPSTGRCAAVLLNHDFEPWKE